MRRLLPITLLLVAAPGCIIRRESLSGGDLDARSDADRVDARAEDAFGRDAHAPDASLDAYVTDTHIDAFTPDPDAFEPDAFEPDAFVPDPDAFVVPEPDAFVVPEPDAFAGLPDAFAGLPDAFVELPDAFIELPDAFVGLPDAFVVPPDAPACVPATETCNGRDDDCNGATDEGVCRTGGATCTAFTFGMHVYQYCRLARSRDDAAGRCAGFPGYALVRIESEAENEAVRMRLMSTVWTQLNDRAVEGSFRFDDGSMASYFRWAMGEPNNFGTGEDCVTMYASGNWNDARCRSAEDFVCERALAP